MSRTESRLVGFVSHLLEPNEREVVLGDLEEGGDSARQSLVAILGLVIRREAALWRNWRPWLAAFGLALPFSFLLMGFSLSVSRAYQQYAGVHVGPGFALLLCNVLLLAGWPLGMWAIRAEGRGVLRRMAAEMASAVKNNDILTDSRISDDIHAKIREIAAQQTAAGIIDRLRHQSVRFQFQVSLLPVMVSFGTSRR